MLSGLLSVVLTAGTLPEACAPPPTRDVSALTTFSQRSGALSVGLDSIATWCFDGEGAWTGGVTAPKPGAKPGAKHKDPPAQGPAPDCAKALSTCQKARTEVNAELKALVYASLADLERPYLGARYTPKRTGLGERPSDQAECESHTRADLFAQAQAQMDLARLASQAQSEYANYRTWLFAEGLKCADLVARQTKDQTRKGVSLDDAVAVDAGTLRVAQVDPAPSTVVVDRKSAPASTVVIERQPTQVVVQGPAALDAGLSPVQVAARPGATSSGTANSGTANSGTTSSGTVNSGTANSGTANSGTANSGAANSGTANSGTANSGATNSGTASSGTANSGTANSGTANSGTTNSGTANSGTTNSGTANSGTAQGAQRPGTSVGVTRSDTAGGNQPTRVAAQPSPVAGPEAAAGGSMAARERALGSTLIEKWRYFAAERSKLDVDPDWASGFLSSRELRDCKCVRQQPADLVRRLEAKDNVPQLEADDAKNTRCELCLEDVYPEWRSRAKKQCALMGELSDYELEVLSRSDDGNGLPPRCFEAVRGRRGTSAPGPATASASGSTPAAGSNGFIITKVPEVPAATPPAPQGNAGGTFVKAGDYAPVPERDEGRWYVRVFMSSACVADIEPGPMQARTGDLLPLPLNAKSLTVRSPCGGMAEAYWGKEEKPRVSETFGKGQPLQLQFAR